MNNFNQQFILSLFIILLGYVLKKIGLVKETDSECLSRIIFNITLPALIINTFSTMKIDFSLLTMTVISVIYGVGIALFGLFMFKKEGKGTRGMLSMLLPGFNIGLFAFPLVEAIWGEEGLKYFVMFDIGNALILFGVCYLIASYFSEQSTNVDVKSIFAKLSKSIPLEVYVIAFLFTLSGLHFPAMILDVTQVLAKANMPLSLLLMGVYVDFSFHTDYGKNIIKVLGFRYIAGLIVGFGFFFVMPFGMLFKYTVLIGLILPIGMAVIPYSTEFSYDSHFVGTVTNITMFISFLLIWIITGVLPQVS